MIGNDIIDRRAIKERSDQHWQRYRDKTMCEAEQHLLAEYREDQLDIWLAWAVKESVYKLEFQLNPERYFSPKAIKVLSLTKAQGKFGTYPIQLEWNNEYLHALTWQKSQKHLNKWIEKWDKMPSNKTIFRHLNKKFPHNHFRLEQGSFPKIINNQKDTWPLSKSHHGDWLSFAYLTP